MEPVVDRGHVRLLGVSNVSAEQLGTLVAQARVQPRFVQNRCYASTGWDRDVRAICNDHGIVYQGFSLLTANREVLADHPLAKTASRSHALPRKSSSDSRLKSACCR